MKFLKLIQSEQEAVKQSYDVLYYNETTSSVTFVSNKVTITFKDWDNSVISTTKYTYGDAIVAPSNPSREGYTFLSWDNEVAATATADTTYKAQYYVNPSVTITMNDSYEDDDAIALSVSKNESVKDGSLTYSLSVGSDIAEITDNIIEFKQHYEGNIVITAAAVNKYDETNTVSDTKTIEVSCGVADTTAHTVVNVSYPLEVQAESTSVTITYKCKVTTTKHDGTIQEVVSDPIEHVIEFAANTTDSAVTISDSFKCGHGDDINYTITQSSYYGYRAIDLGLPSKLKWASCNVGADKPTDNGKYFQWASTVGYYKDEQGAIDNSTWITTPYQTVVTTSYSATKFTKYLGSTDSTYKDPTATDADALKTVLDASDDAAHVIMKGSWRMPTADDFQELYDHTTCTWETIDGVNGRKFTASNGNYIFIPASGYFYDGSFDGEGSSGFCWSSSLYSGKPCSAHDLGFNSSNVYPLGGSYRYTGFSVRGVLASE